MRYTLDFNLKNKEEIAGSNWIEFNISGTKESYELWSDNSKYLAEDAFNFYVDIFEKSAIDFNYYGPAKFEELQLVKVSFGIRERIKLFETSKNLSDLVRMYPGMPSGLRQSIEIIEECDLSNGEQNAVLSDLREVGYGLSNLINKCLEANGILWVLGI